MHRDAHGILEMHHGLLPEEKRKSLPGNGGMDRAGSGADVDAKVSGVRRGLHGACGRGHVGDVGGVSSLDDHGIVRGNADVDAVARRATAGRAINWIDSNFWRTL